MDTAPLAGRASGRIAHAATLPVARTPAVLATSVVAALGVLASSAPGLPAAEPYRSLPQATVLGARGQDVGSALVAALLVVLARPRTIGPSRVLAPDRNHHEEVRR